MEETENLQAVFDKAKIFLTPVLSRGSIETARSLSVLERLHPPREGEAENNGSKREIVVYYALDLLKELCTESNSVTTNEHYSGDSITYEPSNRRVLFGLLDLISLEGIYPSLLPGVGVPIDRRVKSVLPAGVTAQSSPDIHGAIDSGSHALLAEIVVGLLGCFNESLPSLRTLLRDRILVDLVSALYDIVYGPSADLRSSQVEDARTLKELLEKTPAPELLPVLTALNHQATPSWLRPVISAELSLLPLREHGVRHVIEFIASSSNAEAPDVEPRQSKNVNDIDSRGPKIPLEAVTHVSRLLGSVPTSISPIKYFEGIAPQLLDLLDGKDGPEMAKVAGTIIGSGILGRRSIGAPGEAGWTYFAEPILSRIDPSRDEQLTAIATDNQPSMAHVLVSAENLNIAVKRIHTLVSSVPNPGLTKRLVGPIRLPLWGVACTAKLHGLSEVSQQSLSALQTYFKLCAGTEQLTQMSEALQFDGRELDDRGLGWRYSYIPPKCIEISVRSSERSGSESNLISLLEQIDVRINTFVELLTSGVVDDDQLSALFVSLTRSWFHSTADKGHDASDIPKLEVQGSTPRPLQMLTRVKLLQNLVEKVKDDISRDARQMLELIDQLMGQSLQEDASKRQTQESLNKPSWSSLGSIARAQGPRESQDDPDAKLDTVETLTVSLSLMSAVLSSPRFEFQEEYASILESIRLKLKQISSQRSSVPNESKVTADNLALLLEYQSSFYSKSEEEKPVPDHLLEDRKTHSLSLSYLADVIPPVRAQGLSLLTSLINKSSPILDITHTTTLLISILQDGDEYIYLNAIKSLGILALKHPKTVTKNLVEQYVDKDEVLSLDQRLRLGEALSRTIQSLGEVLVGETARLIGEGCLAIASRRAERPKAREEQERSARLQAQKFQEADEAWGGEVPQLNEDAEPDEENEIISKIIEGWEGRGGEEDVRIRASALSVFGTAIETNIAGLGSSLISTGVDLAMSILTLETGEQTAVLRRSAILCLSSLIRALDEARERRRKLGFGLAGENLESIIRVLRYVESTDHDGLVRQHARDIIEGLQTWQSKSMLGLSASERTETETAAPIFGSERLAGLSLSPGEDSGARPKIEEIE